MQRSISNVHHYAPRILCDFLWPGYRLVKLDTDDLNQTIVYLEPTQREATCPHCNKRCSYVHSKQIRTAQDAPIFPHQKTTVVFPVYRYRCACGHTCSDQPSFIAPRARLTKNLIFYLQHLLRTPSLTLKAICELTGVSWPTLLKIDKEQLKFCFDHVNLGQTQNIAIDEFSVHKNHKYATMVIDNDSGQALWLCRGKSRKAIQPFFDELKKRGFSENIKSVSCDMNAAYPRLVRENIPTAHIVYDLFHVMAHFRADVLKEAMLTSKNRLADRLTQQAEDEAKSKGAELDKQALKAKVKQEVQSMSGIDWILIQPAENLTPAKREKLLKTLESDNALLTAIRTIPDMIRNLWKIKDRDKAGSELKKLTGMLRTISSTHNFKPANRFARMLSARSDGIVMAGHYGFTTNRIEGANNKVKVLKRVGYGFRNLDYFFLKVKSQLQPKNEVSFFQKLKGKAVISGVLWTPPWLSTPMETP